MKYPVRSQFTVTGNRLEYEIRFENRSDALGIGMTERATLVKGPAR